MEKAVKQAIMDRASNSLHAGCHCSEGILLAVGEHYVPDLFPELLKAATPFSGGVGGTEEECCGAFSGGLIVVGAMHGRTDPSVNDDHCLKLTAEYRERFLEHFGCLRCKNLRMHWIGKPGQLDCAELTAQAAGLLLDLLEE